MSEFWCGFIVGFTIAAIVAKLVLCSVVNTIRKEARK